jgi:hypothetical protein
MVVDSKSSRSASFSHTAAPRGNTICCDLVCRHQCPVVGNARAASGNHFAMAGGDDMVVW